MKSPAAFGSLAAFALWMFAPRPVAQAWDHAAADRVRTGTVDPAIAAALPGYTFSRDAVAGRSLWFYYEAPGHAGRSIPSLELQITFRDGEPVSPLVNCWQGSPDIFGPVTNFVGDEAIAYDGSRKALPSTGYWIRARVGGRSFFLRDMSVPFASLTTIARALAAALPSLPEPASFQLEESEREQPNPDYLERDRQMFARVTPGLLADPPDLSALTVRQSPFEKGDLGFGYHLENAVAGGGYLSLYGTILTKDHAPEAFRVAAWLPRSPAPADRYRELFHPLFGNATQTAGDPASRVWNYAKAAAPLPTALFAFPLPDAAVNHPDRATIDWLMTPFSGTAYGTSGGYAGGALANRRAWRSLSQLDAATSLYLLRSKNPATRLTAVETLRRHATEWNIDLAALAGAFEAVYQSVPMVSTMRGCICKEENCRALVDELVAKVEPSS